MTHARLRLPPRSPVLPADAPWDGLPPQRATGVGARKSSLPPFAFSRRQVVPPSQAGSQRFFAQGLRLPQLPTLHLPQHPDEHRPERPILLAREGDPPLSTLGRQSLTDPRSTQTESRRPGKAHRQRRNHDPRSTTAPASTDSAGAITGIHRMSLRSVLLGWRFAPWLEPGVPDVRPLKCEPIRDRGRQRVHEEAQAWKPEGLVVSDR